MLETTFAVLAAAQAGMTCYGILLITGGGEMPEQTREFWRVTTHAGENGDQVFVVRRNDAMASEGRKGQEV